MSQCKLLTCVYVENWSCDEGSRNKRHAPNHVVKPTNHSTPRQYSNCFVSKLFASRESEADYLVLSVYFIPYSHVVPYPARGTAIGLLYSVLRTR